MPKLNTSSLVDRISPPFFGTYTVTKHALEGYSQALRYEVSPFGVDIAIVEPGPFGTGLLASGQVPAHIDNQRPAALSDGEFVVPADVVSHLGNGNSNAGAKRLYEMMDRIREARTGSSKQGIQVNPNNFMPG